MSEFFFENSLYGSFFTDVEGCRRMMFEKRMIASGDAVLQCFGEFDTWIPSVLEMYVFRDYVERAGLLDFHQFLFGERYFVQDSSGDVEHVGSYVSFS